MKERFEIYDGSEEATDSDNSAQTATRSDRKVVSTNGMDNRILNFKKPKLL